MESTPPVQRTLFSIALRGAILGGMTTLAVMGPVGVSMLFCTSAKTSAAGTQDWSFESVLLRTVLVTIAMSAAGAAIGAALCLLGGLMSRIGQR
ncbi:hypothetical protein [Planctomicrobium piriforme]|uniref:Uncharacterized protein n=1 Tax=Planctomicrobium piriforme TaxID=1576369 RepID=A0A1I3Q9R0_9PLAN|nr:hypothetical protein [Planctomicrobium piriforme]SFJ30648.1 hypothetical protein SAMN05421753_11817 [Planctomicrobium piriforme]